MHGNLYRSLMSTGTRSNSNSCLYNGWLTTCWIGDNGEREQELSTNLCEGISIVNIMYWYSCNRIYNNMKGNELQLTHLYMYPMQYALCWLTTVCFIMVLVFVMINFYEGIHVHWRLSHYKYMYYYIVRPCKYDLCTTNWSMTRE